MNLRLLTAAGLASLALVAAGCGSDDSSSSSSSSSDSSSADTTQTSSTEAPSTSTEAASGSDAAKTFPGKAIAVSNATDLKHKPKVAKPTGDPPSQLVVKDLVVGKGPAAKAGDTLSVAYVGKAFSTGKQFDASWDRPGPAFQFPLGGGQVIQGWDQGLVGMKKGGRRELIIPADLGYGPQGSPPDIAGGETLVFVVDLKKIN